MGKNYLIAITILFFSLSTGIKAQSVTVTKVLHYLEIQNQIEIEKDLIKVGFKFNKKRSESNMTQYSYYKADNYGLKK